MTGGDLRQRCPSCGRTEFEVGFIASELGCADKFHERSKVLAESQEVRDELHRRIEPMKGPPDEGAGPVIENNRLRAEVKVLAESIQNIARQRDALHRELADATKRCGSPSSIGGRCTRPLGHAAAHAAEPDGPMWATFEQQAAEIFELRATLKRREPWVPGQPEWRTGGSPGTHGLTLYQRNELAGLFLDPATAADVADTLNSDRECHARWNAAAQRAEKAEAKLAEAEREMHDARQNCGLTESALAFTERNLAEAEKRAADAEKLAADRLVSNVGGWGMYGELEQRLASAEAALRLKDVALRGFIAQCDAAAIAATALEDKKAADIWAKYRPGLDDALKTQPAEALRAFGIRVAEATICTTHAVRGDRSGERTTATARLVVDQVLATPADAKGAT